MDTNCAPYEEVLEFWKKVSMDLHDGPIDHVVQTPAGNFIAVNAAGNNTCGVDMDGSCEECSARVARAIVATGYTLRTPQGKVH